MTQNPPKLPEGPNHIPADDLLSIREEPVKQALSRIAQQIGIAIHDAGHDPQALQEVTAAGKVLARLSSASDSSAKTVIARARYSHKNTLGWALQVLEAHQPELKDAAATLRAALHIENKTYTLDRWLKKEINKMPAPIISFEAG